MSCDTKQNTLDYLKRKEVISDMRVITEGNLEKFNTENDKMTKLAKDKYGLEANGKKLYVIEKVDRAYDNNKIDNRKSTTLYATPVDELFEELDLLHEKKNILEADALRVIFTRTPKTRIAYVGPNYSSGYGNHYVSNQSIASKVDTKVQFKNKDFLNSIEDDVLYDKIVKEFKANTGYSFDISKKTAHDLEMHQKFFKLLASKGLKGVELTDNNNDTHFISLPAIESGSQIEMPQTDIDTNVEEVSGYVVKSQLEKFKWFHQNELDKIYDKYSPEQVNTMLEENQQDAIDVFTQMLYPNEFKNDIFVTTQDVNDQIRKCK
jgi:hypothetical protein